ncbi:hypothetical protein SAMN05216312_107184 [Cohnella sp. OV330]|uniref:hypothetical protein n=1 Tax=Cohnella sp. OV330 TaxID=1855288 RepID=UPI0008E20C96|nr:hypothetical protein [Cohnella sp. OV330]SFB40844.1 hypothetical protein SAMN05216312_107184 [Cohnella sp. OV330]
MRQSPKEARMDRAGRTLPGADRREAQSLMGEEFAAELAPRDTTGDGGMRPRRPKRG